jgi:hypothetical protein
MLGYKVLHRMADLKAIVNAMKWSLTFSESLRNVTNCM